MDRIALASLGHRYRDPSVVGEAYDAVVIGSGMGGLAAASMLAQRGRAVLLLEQNDLLGGCTQSYERKGYRWNIGVHYIGSVRGPTMTRRLFDAVCPGIEWAHLPDVYNRMVVDDRLYEVPGGLEAYRGMLRERFSDEVEAIDAYLDAVVNVPRASRGYFGQKALPEKAVGDRFEAMSADFHAFSDLTTEQALSRWTDNPELKAVLTANWGDYGLPPSRSSFAMHCMLVQHYLDGASFPVGGPVAFASKVLPLLEANGGRAVRGAEVERILVEEGVSRGVRLVGGQEVRAPIVISNAGVQNTFGRLLDPADAAPFALKDKLREVGDSYAVVGLNLGLRGTAEALELVPANIWAHPSPDFDANLAAHRSDFEAPFPWTFLTFPSAKDPHWERDYPGRSTVEMYGYTFFEHFEQWAGLPAKARGGDYAEMKKRVGERLLDALCRYAPKVRDAVDVMEVSTPLSYERHLRRARGGFMGLEASPSRFRARWLRSPTSIRGLFLSGQDVVSDGIIGALTGGVIAASAALGEDLMTEIARRPRRA